MFQSAHAQNTTWQSALQNCLDELEENLGATLGFVYVTDVIAPHLSSILESLKNKTGINRWVGSASPGICSIGSNGAREYFGVPAINLGSRQSNRVSSKSVINEEIIDGKINEASPRNAVKNGKSSRRIR